MREKKKTNVQPVEKEKAGSEAENTEVQGAPVVSEAVHPIQIPKKVLDQAKAFGIDLNQIVDWASSVETRFKQVTEALNSVGASMEQLAPLIQVSQQLAQRQAQPQSETPSSTGGIANTLPSLLQLLPSLLGSNSNPISDVLQQKIIESGIEQMTAGTTLLKAMQRKILSDMGAKMAVEMTGNE